MGFHIPSNAEIQQVALSRGRDSCAPEQWEGLTGDLPMQERGGDECIDVSGNRNTATMTNMDPPTDRVETEIGRALDLDGANDHLVCLTKGLSASAGTVSMWAYQRTLDAATRFMLLHLSGAGNRIYLFSRNAIGNMESQLGNSWKDHGATASIDLNTWIYWVLTWDGTTGALYKNGRFTTSYAYVNLAAINPTLTISAGTTDYDGLLTKVSFWSRPRALSEIEEEYADPWARHRLRTKVFRAAVAGITVTPAPVVANWSAVAPTTAKRVAASPVSATWSAPAPTVRKITSVSPATAAWSVAAPTVRKLIGVNPLVATWSAVAPTTAKRTTPSPASAAWSIVAPTTLKRFTPSPATATWSIVVPTTVKRFVPSPAIATWSAPAPRIAEWGPWLVAAGEIWHTGQVAGQSILAGALAGDVFHSGRTAGDLFLTGAAAGDVQHSGKEVGYVRSGD